MVLTPPNIALVMALVAGLLTALAKQSAEQSALLTPLPAVEVTLTTGQGEPIAAWEDPILASIFKTPLRPDSIDSPILVANNGGQSSAQ